MELFQRCGRYTLMRKIANGGMAEVFLARQEGPQGFAKDVAVKRLLSDGTSDPAASRALVDEAKALVRIRHQNIVEIYELGEEGGQVFIAMEYVHGVDLSRILSDVLRMRVELSREHVLHIVTQMLEGLDFAHRAVCAEGTPLHIVHRDVSPPNVLCSFSGAVKVADFGVAKGMHRAHQTTTCTIKGKYAYMAPEQLRGGPVDARVDVAACGIILFELLSRRRLFEGTSDADVIEAVKNWKIPHERIADQPRDLRRICTRALERQPAGRYPSAAAFRADLNRYVLASNASILPSELGAWLMQHYYDDGCVVRTNEDCKNREACAHGGTRAISAEVSFARRRWSFSMGAALRRIVAVLALSAVCGALPAVVPSRLTVRIVDASIHAPRETTAAALPAEEDDANLHKRRSVTPVVHTMP